MSGVGRGRLLAAGLVGLLSGAALVWPLAAWRLQELGVQNDALRLALEDAQRQVERLEASAGRLREPIVTAVAVETDVQDPVERTRVEGPLRELVGQLVGRPLSRLDPDVVRSALDGRLIEVDGRVYRVTLAFALLAPESRFRFHVALVARGATSRAGPEPP